MAWMIRHINGYNWFSSHTPLRGRYSFYKIEWSMILNQGKVFDSRESAREVYRSLPVEVKQICKVVNQTMREKRIRKETKVAPKIAQEVPIRTLWGL